MSDDVSFQSFEKDVVRANKEIQMAFEGCLVKGIDPTAFACAIQLLSYELDKFKKKHPPVGRNPKELKEALMNAIKKSDGRIS